jgi:hypothetical protein
MMKISHWASFSLACGGLLPMASAPLFGPIIENSLREAVMFGALLVGMLSASWFFRICRSSA